MVQKIDGTDWREWLYLARYASRRCKKGENRNFAINAFLHTSWHDSFVRQVEQINIDVLVNEVRKKLMTEHIPNEIYSMIKVYCYGTVQFTFEWLLNGVKIPPETMVYICESSIPEPLKKYLYE